MKPKGAPVQAEHHGGIGMSQNPVDLYQTELAKSSGEPILEEKALLRPDRFTMSRLPRFPASRLPRLQSP
jgi:hypothetical protein